MVDKWDRAEMDSVVDNIVGRSMIGSLIVWSVSLAEVEEWDGIGSVLVAEDYIVRSNRQMWLDTEDFVANSKEDIDFASRLGRNNIGVYMQTFVVVVVVVVVVVAVVEFVSY